MLNGKYITLRAPEPSDADLLYQWENDFELWKVSNTTKPFSKNLINKYIENEHLDIFQLKQLRLMIVTAVSHETIGMIDLFDFDVYNSSAGVGIMIHKDYRENGYAYDSLVVLCDYVFNFLNIHQIFCNISENNLKSIKLFEKAGFEKNGLKKDWIFNGNNYENVFFYQKINQNHIFKKNNENKNS